jgi:hypothetical protein
MKDLIERGKVMMRRDLSRKQIDGFLIGTRHGACAPPCRLPTMPVVAVSLSSLAESAPHRKRGSDALRRSENGATDAPPRFPSRTAGVRGGSPEF